MAQQEILEEFALGSAARDCRGRRVVRSDAGPAWLEVCRSIHRSASLRAICHQQVSSSRALLFLSYRAHCFGGALDDISRCRVFRLASLALARTNAPRSPARFRFLLDHCSSCLLFLLGIKTNGLYFAGPARSGVTHRRTDHVLSA